MHAFNAPYLNFCPSSDSKTGPKSTSSLFDITFQLFQAMEHELRRHLRKDKAPTLNDGVKQALVVNEDFQFLWSMISVDWEEASPSALLQTIVNQWVKIYGFSYAGAWVE